MNGLLTQSLQVKTTDLAYLAGIIDGEGTIGIYRKGGTTKRPHYEGTVIVVQRDPTIPQWIQQRFGGSLIHRVFRIRGGKRDRYTYWRWYLIGKKIGPFLERCLPYLIIKREQAECAIELAGTILRGGREWTQVPKNKPISKGRWGRIGRPFVRSPEVVSLQESLYKRCRHLNSGSLPEG